MDEQAAMFMEALNTALDDLPDPRVVGRCDHLLIDIIAISLLAVMSGMDDWKDIELFGELREDWLRSFLQLPNGIPSHDTFRRVISALDRQEFAVCLFKITQSFKESITADQIAIDGKSLRDSFSNKHNLPMLHLVSAWATQSGITLNQVACEDKSNEITAIPILLQQLDIKGCTVSIDAMGCQTEIAAQIRQKKGHYVLGLKNNQPTLYAEMQKLFAEGQDRNFKGLKHSMYESKEQAHGRIDERYCHVIEIPQDHPQREKWKDLKTLAVTISRRVVAGKESWESRYYISSQPAKAQKLALAIRRHWSIENSLHWVLDIAFGEDSQRQQDRNGASNLAAIRRLVVSILRQEKTTKRGAKGKRHKCALDPNYIFKALKTMIF